MENREEITTLPHNNELESLVISSMIDYGMSRVSNVEMIDEECFYDDFNRDVFNAIREIENAGDNADSMSIFNNFKKKNKTHENLAYRISQFGGKFTNNANHVLILKEKSLRRKLFAISEAMRKNALSDFEDVFLVIDEAKTSIDGILINTEQSVFTLSDAVKGVYEQIKRNYNSDDVLTGIPTGFNDFDRKGGGLQKSDLVIIAAETSQGKSSLAISITDFATQYGYKCAFYSLEMKKEQIAARILSIHSGVPANEILYSRLGSDKISQIQHEADKLTNSCLFFDDRSTSNIETIISSIRSLKLKHGIDFVIIDYLQILNVNMKGSNKETQMGEVARRLKNLAKDLDICIIALSQLNRNTNDPLPNLNRLRDSGQIAEAADIVMFIYRPELYQRQYPDPFRDADTYGTAMIDIAKGRNIGILKMLVRFNAPTTHFYDLIGGIPVRQNEDEPF